jgi:hypothetical protein
LYCVKQAAPHGALEASGFRIVPDQNGRFDFARGGSDSRSPFFYNVEKERPMTTITPEIRQAIEQAGDRPVHLTDPETNFVYVVVRAEVYERLRALDDIQLSDAYSLMDQVAACEGLDDPSMDVYNEYPPPAQKRRYCSCGLSNRVRVRIEATACFSHSV